MLEGVDFGFGKVGWVGFYVENYVLLDFDDIGFLFFGVLVMGVSLDVDVVGLIVGEWWFVVVMVVLEDVSDVWVIWMSDVLEVVVVFGGWIVGVVVGMVMIIVILVVDLSFSDMIIVIVDDVEYLIICFDG